MCRLRLHCLWRLLVLPLLGVTACDDDEMLSPDSPKLEVDTLAHDNSELEDDLLSRGYSELEDDTLSHDSSEFRDEHLMRRRGTSPLATSHGYVATRVWWRRRCCRSLASPLATPSTAGCVTIARDGFVRSFRRASPFVMPLFASPPRRQRRNMLAPPPCLHRAWCGRCGAARRHRRR